MKLHLPMMKFSDDVSRHHGSHLDQANLNHGHHPRKAGDDRRVKVRVVFVAGRKDNQFQDEVGQYT